MEEKEYDIVVIGAGFAGATIANKMANYGKKVLIIDKRDHVGGNMYECYSNNGVRIHLYGPHIFHTNSEKVFNYLKNFSEFYKYEHKVIGNIDGKLVPIPFNYKSLEILFDLEKANIIEEKLNKKYGEGSKVSIYNLINDEDEVIRKFGNYVYDKVFAQYTAKQWEMPIDKIDNSVINRVPVVLGYDDRYFNDTIQYMPEEGFSVLIQNMLNHDNIDIKVNTNSSEIIKLDFNNNKVYLFDKEFLGKVFFTGAVDELLNYKYGALPYRSLNLVFEEYDEDYYQSNSVINYNTSEKYTRITEFKYLTNQKLNGRTTILKEYPLRYDHLSTKSDPYYPINNKENLELYDKYKKDIEKFSNIYLCGRLAEYKYYNMDAVVESVLNLFEELKEGNQI